MGELHRHKHRDPLTNLAEGLSETISFVFGLFESKRKPESPPETRITTLYPEFECLYQSERNLITSPVELCIGNLRSLVKNTYCVDFEAVYNRLYSIIPSSMVDEMTSSMDSYWNQRCKLFDGDETYEEIMKTFMDFAADLNNVPWFIQPLIGIFSPSNPLCLLYYGQYYLWN